MSSNREQRSGNSAQGSTVDRTERKRERMSMGNGGFLDVKQERGYHYYYFDAKLEGRIDHAKRCGYEFVLDSEGHQVRRKKHGSELCLMRIPDEFWQEDFEDGQRKIDEMMGKKLSVESSGAVPDYIPTDDYGRQRKSIVTTD